MRMLVIGCGPIGKRQEYESDAELLRRYLPKWIGFSRV